MKDFYTAFYKLIVIEGIPGSGKSSMAAFVHRWLAENGFSARFFQEGNPDHPADFESMAYFDRPDWGAFLASHPQHRLWLEQQVERGGQDCFIHYRKARLPDGQAIPESLFAELAQRDVYEIAEPATYRRLALERWQAFAEIAGQEEAIYVFECCLLQNPLAVLTLKHNRPIPETLGHIQTTLAAIQPLNPILIYLRQNDPRATFERVAAGRPQEWKDFIIGYTENGAWGNATGRRGFDSVIAYHALRQEAELELLAQLQTPKIVIDQSDLDWASGQKVAEAFLANLLIG